MQNVQVIGRIAMSPTRSETMAVTPDRALHGNADHLAARGRVRCRWRATDDGALRMEWLSTPNT
jgi:hypothetical protein